MAATADGAGGEVGLVLGGGGARGAYASGAVLLPELKDQVRVIALPSSSSGDKHLALVFGQMMALPRLEEGLARLRGCVWSAFGAGLGDDRAGSLRGWVAVAEVQGLSV